MEMVAALLIVLVGGASGRQQEELVPLDWQILSALEATVDALGSRMHMMYVDGAVGLRFADDRLQTFLDLLAPSEAYTGDGVLKPLPESFKIRLHDVKVLQMKAEELADKAAEDVLKTTNLEMLSRGVLQNDFWRYAPIGRDAQPSDNASGSASQYQIFEATSDRCITQLFSRTGCRALDSTCWETMTGGRHHGYALTHQILFLTIALKLNCTDVTEAYGQHYGQPLADSILASKCDQVAGEAQTLADEGFSYYQRDLFLEQVTVCGFTDHDVFRNTAFMKAALSWQRDDGCYGLPTRTEVPQRHHRRRAKREEKTDVDGCSMHTTAVAAGALSTYLGILLRAELAGVQLLT